MGFFRRLSSEDLKSRFNSSSKNALSLQELFIEVLSESGQAINSCENLETSSLANSVTATNMVSIVTMLEADGKKYLFTGDAGIESFTEHTGNWESDLKDLYFLDVPHHGSRNNLSQRQAEVFNPEIAFVSGKNGSNRPSVFIKECIRSKIRNREFEVTNADPSTWYLKVGSDGMVSRVPLT